MFPYINAFGVPSRNWMNKIIMEYAPELCGIFIFTYGNKLLLTVTLLSFIKVKVYLRGNAQLTQSKVTLYLVYSFVWLFTKIWRTL